MEFTIKGIDGQQGENRNRKVLKGDMVNHIMQLSPVIKCVYKYLSLADIKNCRLVSREWNVNSKVVMGHRSKIVFSKEERERRDCIPKFLEFSKTTNIVFDAFKFGDGAWKIKELKEFFENGNNIAVLELGFMVLGDDERRNFIGMYDITPWISLMTEPNAKYNSKLSVLSSKFGIWNPITYFDYGTLKADRLISLSALVTLKEISLVQVSINVKNTGGIKISPVKLILNEVKFVLDEVELNEIRITDFVDFSKCKSVFLMGGSTKLSLDLSGNDSIDSLTLNDIKVNNWSNSSWKVNELNLVKMPLLEMAGMKIVKLNFSNSDIDLTCLPESIESLTVELIKFSSGSVKCDHPISLPNLRFLYLKFHKRERFSVLSNLDCPKLVDLHINGCYVIDIIPINFSWIPKTVRRLKLIEMEAAWEEMGEGPLQLDQLVFLDCTFENVNRNCIDNIQVKEIILNSKVSRRPTAFTAFPFLDLLEYFNRQPRTIYVGPLNWKGGSPLESYVDKISEYYVFENQRGKAIDKSVFDQVANKSFSTQ